MPISGSRSEQVKKLVQCGLDDTEISVKLGIKENTVRRYKRRFREAERTTTCRILLLDIETSPMEVLVWGLYKQRIPHDNIIKEWAILSWSAKWLFEPDIISMVATPQEATDREDLRLVGGIWELLEEADIVLAHNAIRFDIRKLNARFHVNGLKPPMPYQVIDTLKQTQKLFAFSSHKLDHLTQMMGISPKLETGYKLWKRCVGMYGLEEQESALIEMQRYNDSDVRALEELYLEIRPWIKSHPNLGLYVEVEGGTISRCPNCGGPNITYADKKHYYTPAGRFRSFRCECGAIGRSRISDISTRERANLVVSVAR